MKKIVVVGAGKIGSTIAEMLAATGDYEVTLVDRSAAQLAAAELPATVATLELDIERRPLPPDHAHCRGSGKRRRALSRPHRGRRQHQAGQAAGAFGQERLHPTMRTGAGLHLDRRQRSRQPLRFAGKRAHARWRACRNTRRMP